MAKIVARKRNWKSTTYVTNYIVSLQKSKIEEFDFAEKEVEIEYTKDLIILKKINKKR